MRSTRSISCTPVGSCDRCLGSKERCSKSFPRTLRSATETFSLPDPPESCPVRLRRSRYLLDQKCRHYLCPPRAGTPNAKSPLETRLSSCDERFAENLELRSLVG